MIKLINGDITGFEGDSLVNAANKELKGGGGVDGAIHKAAGPQLLRDCQTWINKNGPLSTGEAIITSAGKLRVRFVIHTVGPVWEGGMSGEDQLLGNCYINSLKLVEEHSIHSIAFPNISTGVYGYPKTDAAEIAVTTVQNYLSSITDPPEVYFYCYDQENYELYKKLLPLMSGNQ